MQGTFARRDSRITQRSIAPSPCAALNRPVHPSLFDKMADFVQKYLHARRAEPLVILDLGSQDINGSYRPLFGLPPWKYVGLDLAPGANVDVVLSDPYDWREIAPDSADVIVA